MTSSNIFFYVWVAEYYRTPYDEKGIKLQNLKIYVHVRKVAIQSQL